MKLKHLSNLIQKYAERLSSQAERQLALINAKEPARNVDDASNAVTIESLLLHALLHHLLYSFDMTLIYFEIYVLIDVNSLERHLSDGRGMIPPNLMSYSNIFIIMYF